MAQEFDQIVTFFKNLGSSEVAQALSQADASLGKLKERAGEVGQSVKEIGSSAAQSLKQIDNISINNLIQNLAKSNKELVSFGAQAGLIGMSLRSNFKPEAFNVLADAAKESTSELDGTLDNLEKLLGINLGKDNPLAKVFDTMEDLMELGDFTKQLEMGLISTAASSGQLGDLLESTGDDFEGLTRKAEQFSRITYDIANVAGLSQKKVADYAKGLMTIPGAMDTVIESQEKGIQDMHLLEATMKVATGTGVGFSQTLQDIKFQYEELGTTGKEALEYTSRLSQVSQNLRIPMENVRDYTQGAARSFRFLGDNTQGAINVFERFAPTLQKTGLGVRAVSDLIGGVTQNISQMGIAQKAFLSSQTGGPGGLQGGYQIEYLMQQGKVDEVYKKVEESLRRQFGGRIVTLEEAAKDNRSAGQFTKQVQLLTQGPTKIANSEQEAYKILEVLAKGGPSKAGPSKTPEEAFRSALETGDKLQERQTNILTKIENETERGVQLASISAYNLTRLVAGTQNESLKKVIEESRQKSSELMGTAEAGKLFTGQGYLQGGQEVSEVTSDFMSDFGSQTRTGKRMITEFFSNLFSVSKEQAGKLLPEGFGQEVASAAKQKLAQASQTAQDKMEIVVQSVCPDCNREVARTEATRVGKELIERRDSNRAIAVHTGVDHGI